MLISKKRYFALAALLLMSLSVTSCSDKSRTSDNDAGESGGKTSVIAEIAETSTKSETDKGDNSPKESKDSLQESNNSPNESKDSPNESKVTPPETNGSTKEGMDSPAEKENSESATADPENKKEGREIRHIAENIDINKLPDGKYPVKIFFDNMKRNEDSLSLDFMIYTVVHYAPEDIYKMTRGDIIYEYVDETTTKNYVIDTVNFPIDEVCVVNGGSERGEGITFSLDDSGLYRVSVNEGYTRNSSHGVVTLEIPDSVTFEDNHKLADSKQSGRELYDYFKGLGDSEKEYFNQNNTFITVSKGKISGFNRVYLP